MIELADQLATTDVVLMEVLAGACDDGRRDGREAVVSLDAHKPSGVWRGRLAFVLGGRREVPDAL